MNVMVEPDRDPDDADVRKETDSSVISSEIAGANNNEDPGHDQSVASSFIDDADTKANAESVEHADAGVGVMEKFCDADGDAVSSVHTLDPAVEDPCSNGAHTPTSANSIPGECIMPSEQRMHTDSLPPKVSSTSISSTSSILCSEVSLLAHEYSVLLSANEPDDINKIDDITIRALPLLGDYSAPQEETGDLTNHASSSTNTSCIQVGEQFSAHNNCSSSIGLIPEVAQPYTHDAVAPHTSVPASNAMRIASSIRHRKKSIAYINKDGFKHHNRDVWPNKYESLDYDMNENFAFRQKYYHASIDRANINKKAAG